MIKSVNLKNFFYSVIFCLFFVFFYSTASANDGATTTLRAVNFNIRNGDSIVWSGQVSVPDSDTATTTITATDGTAAERYVASVLSALVSADAAQPEFSVSNLQYYSSFSSFYLKCITAQAELCDNWQYVVNNVSPSSGLDQYLLHDGDVVYLYFGSPRRVTLSAASAVRNLPVTATAEKYDPTNNSYVPLTGFTVGVTQPNPENPWSPIEVATSTVNADGQAVFTINATGTYQVGLQEDFYFPTTNLEVTDAPAPAPVVQIVGGAPSVIHRVVDVNKAARFLLDHQLEDGSFGGLLYTDWAVIALAANGNSTSKAAEYMKSASGGMSSVSDYERHAMALMVLGINPYSGTSINYIQKIIGAFDGNQIGDAGLVNDDIFSLFPLTKAGYASSDQIIEKIKSFILGKQLDNGSWENSADLTAAAIQALSLDSFAGETSPAISKAREYLLSRQNSDGGFGTSYSTSWALQAIAALRESGFSWIKDNNNPYDSLYSFQADDGGMESSTSTDLNSRIWATSYAIPASLNKTWDSLLISFPKEVPVQPAPSVPLQTGGFAVQSAGENINTSSAIAETATSSVVIEAFSSIAIATSSTVAIPSSTASVPADTAVAKIPPSPDSGRQSVSEIQKTGPKTGGVAIFSSSSAEKTDDASEKIESKGTRQFASIASIIGANIINFAVNIGSLIVSKLFSIIGL